MATSSQAYHEPPETLSVETRDLHRAIVSVIEELEAIDWYRQRADACDDEALEAILLHNLEEELEHAVMGIEWLRRRLPTLDALARRYLFTEGPIARRDPGGGARDTSLGIGSLRNLGR